MDFFQYPLFWSRDLEYHLIGLQVHQGFVSVDSIADMLVPAQHGGIGD